MKARCPFFFSLLFTICLSAAGWSQTGGQAEYQLHLSRRINAHGDEFNAAALTPDERYLIFTQRDYAGSDLMLVKDFVAPR